MTRNRRALCLLALGLALGLALFGCRAPQSLYQPTQTPAPTASAQPEVQPMSAYAMALVIDAEQGTLSGDQTLDYYNGTGQTLDSVYFHLYPNAFAAEDGPGAAGATEEIYPNGFDAGGIAVSDAKVNGETAAFAVEGDSDQVLKVSLAAPLAAGERTSIALTFVVDVPICQGRFGRTASGSMFRLAYAYPMVCMYDADGWHTEGYTAMGDPTYSALASYDVTVTCPAAMVLATGADTQTVEQEGETNKYTLHGNAMREFAAVGCNGFQTLTTNADGVELTSYYYGESETAAKDYLDTAAQAVQVFAKAFGQPYPGARLSIVECGLDSSGMEYSGLTMLNEPIYAEDQLSNGRRAVAHEIAHQWFYGLVGNDQANAPFLDEAFAQYAMLYYFEATGQSDERAKWEADLRTRWATAVQETPEVVSKPVTCGVTQFANAREYGEVVYMRGTLELLNLRAYLGDQAFETFLQTLNARYAGGFLTQDGLALSLNELQPGAGDWFIARLNAPYEETGSTATPAVSGTPSA